MMGRRIAAMLCVLLVHASMFRLFQLDAAKLRDLPDADSEAPLIAWQLLMDVEPVEEEEPPPPPSPEPHPYRPPTPPVAEAAASETQDAAALDAAALAERHARIDWPIEGREAAKRVLQAEAEAERIAKMFAGPKGTWASLTKRQRDELNHFRWAPGVDGLERDENGNTIYRLKNGCVLVNFLFFGCPIGAKPPPYGDLFKDMQLYFDEQRRPRTNEGNGTEPESRRPPKWSKPLPERDP